MSAIHNSSLYENRASCTVFNPSFSGAETHILASFPYIRVRFSTRVLSGAQNIGYLQRSRPRVGTGKKFVLEEEKTSVL